MEFAIALVLLLGLTGVVVARPLLFGIDEDNHESVDRAELEAAKESKYAEIRDAQLEFEMGKLSKEDHRAIDSDLRAEAIAILKQLDALETRAPDA